MKTLCMAKIPKKLKNHFNLMSFVLNTDIDTDIRLDLYNLFEFIHKRHV